MMPAEPAVGAAQTNPPDEQCSMAARARAPVRADSPPKNNRPSRSALSIEPAEGVNRNMPDSRAAKPAEMEFSMISANSSSRASTSAAVKPVRALS